MRRSSTDTETPKEIDKTRTHRRTQLFSASMGKHVTAFMEQGTSASGLSASHDALPNSCASRFALQDDFLVPTCCGSSSCIHYKATERQFRAARDRSTVVVYLILPILLWHYAAK